MKSEGAKAATGIDRTVARNTAEFRKRMGLSQETLAAGARLRRKTIFNAEKRGNVSTRTLEKLAGVFGVPAATMLEEDEGVALALFLASQVARLGEGPRRMFDRALEKNEIRSQPNAEAIWNRQVPTDSGEFAREHVPALLRLPRSEWRGKLKEDPRFVSVESAWEILHHAERVTEENPGEAIAGNQFAVELIEEIARTQRVPPELRAIAWKDLGWTLRIAGQFTEAEAALRTAEKAARQCDNAENMLARVALSRAILLTDLQRFDEALVLTRQSGEVFAATGDSLRTDMALEQEALIGMLTGKDIPGSIAVLKKLASAGPEDTAKARRYASLASAYFRDGALGPARHYSLKARKLHSKLGANYLLLHESWALGKIMAAAGDVDGALKTLRPLSKAFRKLDAVDSAIRVNLDLCEIETEHSRQDADTFARLQAAASYAIEKGLPLAKCRALQFLQRLGDNAKASHIRYVKEFMTDVAPEPGREFEPPEN